MFTPDANDEDHTDLTEDQIEAYAKEGIVFLHKRACCNVSASIIAFNMFNSHVQAMIAEGIHPNVRMGMVHALLEVVRTLGGEVQFLQVERPAHDSN